MLKIYTPLLVLFALLSASAGAVDFDRTSEHQARLAGQSALRREQGGETRATALSSASFSDLLVSDVGYPARFTQDHARLLPISQGRWIAAWNDERMGASKIFWQVLDSLGSPEVPNQLVAGSSVGNDFVDPLLISDVRGKVYLFYRDQSAGEVFVTRFNTDLTLDLVAKRINDTALGAYAGPFDAAVLPDGHLVVTWENYGPSEQTIMFCLLDSSTAVDIGPVAASIHSGSTQKWVPAVAVDPSTGFLIAWEDYRNGNADIYARQFDGAGTPVGADFSIVPSPAADEAQYAPRIAFCGADKYVIGWLDRRSGQEVYIQQISPVTGLVGVNRLISIADTLTTNWNIDLATSPASTLCASWGAFGAANNIISARFAAGLTMIGSPTARNIASTGSRWSPTVAYVTNKRYAMVWTEFQSENANINLMLFDTAAVRRLGSEKVLNDDQAGSPSIHPSITASNDWYDLVVFESRRRDKGDIYCQAISIFGVIPEHNQRVNQDSGSNLQSEPFVCAASNKVLVAWIDSRPLAGLSGQRVFARFGSQSGLFTESELCISDTPQADVKSMPRCALTTSGRALVTWTDRRDGSPQVWGKWLTTTGALDGAEFQLSNAVTDLWNDRLMTSCDTLGRFFVTWLDRGSAAPTVKCRWFNNDKSAGGNWSWAPSIGVKIDNISTVALPNGSVAILWTGLDVTVERLYMAVITPAGGVSRQLFDLADSPSAKPEEPTISAASNGYLSTAWVDSRGGSRQVYYQLYDPAFSPINSNAPVSGATPEFMTQAVTHTSRGRAWFAWVDPREYGLQVYASNLVYLPTDVDDPDDALPADFALAQNYPNPFNPSTTIEFSLPKASDVTLSIYNVLGQSVATLADNAQYPAGTHKVVWDGHDQAGASAASGIYFYRISAGDFVQQRKMVLLK